jgi:hypothetical protein
MFVLLAKYLKLVTLVYKLTPVIDGFTYRVGDK